MCCNRLIIVFTLAWHKEAIRHRATAKKMLICNWFSLFSSSSSCLVRQISKTPPKQQNMHMISIVDNLSPLNFHPKSAAQKMTEAITAVNNVIFIYGSTNVIIHKAANVVKPIIKPANLSFLARWGDIYLIDKAIVATVRFIAIRTRQISIGAICF